MLHEKNKEAPTVACRGYFKESAQVFLQLQSLTSHAPPAEATCAGAVNTPQAPAASNEPPLQRMRLRISGFAKSENSTEKSANPRRGGELWRRRSPAKRAEFPARQRSSGSASRGEHRAAELLQ